ncbi:recombinase family protein [Brevundimonas sp.]|uniref:recombinase family protein n=1 Tax=Brevundimonas sp. TaxID=1871086 RepID=UPI0035B3EFD7
MTAVLRCAVYTRKSCEEGLEQAFNSLHSQREACEAYIKSQQHEGWTLVETAYDDGAYSGGNMQRPALLALLEDVKAGKVDVIVVYKVDRLTRSLPDFARIVDVLDAAKASFVSVTQAFNTTTSMGRLTLNVLLSFAQFEREVTGERIRDKIAASKAKGMWMGGLPPLGYDAGDGKLNVNPAEASQVNRLFALFLQTCSVDKLLPLAEAEGLRTKARKSAAGQTGGKPYSRGTVYHLLANRIYVGEVKHKGKHFPGQHQPIVDPETFEMVQAIIASNRHKRAMGGNATEPSLLAGLLVDGQGRRFTPTHTNRRGRKYRYYARAAEGADDALRLPAEPMDQAVLDTLREFLKAEERVLSATGAKTSHDADAAIKASRAASVGLEDQNPKGLRQRLRAMVDAVVLGPDQIALTLRPDALAGLTLVQTDLTAPISIARRGRDLKLVVEGQSQGPDQKLINLIALASTWFDEVAQGRVATLTALAEREGVTPAYVAQVIDLAFLAPTIKQSILQGRQAPGLTTMTLKAMRPLPLCWDQQQDLLATSH